MPVRLCEGVWLHANGNSNHTSLSRHTHTLSLSQSPTMATLWFADSLRCDSSLPFVSLKPKTLANHTVVARATAIQTQTLVHVSMLKDELQLSIRTNTQQEHQH